MDFLRQASVGVHKISILYDCAVKIIVISSDCSVAIIFKCTYLISIFVVHDLVEYGLVQRSVIVSAGAKNKNTNKKIKEDRCFHK